MNCFTPVDTNNCFSNVYIREVVRSEIQKVAECLKGDSAYSIAVNNGYVGTEDEWLDSLGGTISDIKAVSLEAGSAPSANLSGTPRNRIINLGIPKGEKGEEGIQGIPGPIGPSAYDVAVANGFDGTKTDWLLAIKGAKGDVGPEGPKGEEGKSTYELSVDYGYSGSEREWLSGLINDTELMSNLNQDLISIDEVANGDENTTVVTRTGETYPSAKKAISEGIVSLFENGGLPAKPFATEALMTASALVDGDYALVTDDDVAKNGLYIKESGTWVKSKYGLEAMLESNPLTSFNEIPEDITDFNDIPTGMYLVKPSAANLLNAPPVSTSYFAGTLISFNIGHIAYQKFIHYNSYRYMERVGNGGTRGGSFDWYEWKDVITQENIHKHVVMGNDFYPNPSFEITPRLLHSGDSTVETDNGTELVLKGGKLSYFYERKYPPFLYFKEGDEIEITVEIKGTTNPEVEDPRSYDIGFQFYTSDGSSPINMTTQNHGQLTGEWRTLKHKAVVPKDLLYVVYRITSRENTTEDTVVRNVRLTNLTNPVMVNIPEFKSSLQNIEDSITKIKDTALKLELFPNPNLTKENSTSFRGTTEIEDGISTHTLLTNGSINYTYYEAYVDGTLLRVGDTITFSIEGFTDVSRGLDISIEFLDASRRRVLLTSNIVFTTENEWSRADRTAVIPEGTVYINLRIITRGTSQVAKVRSPSLVTSNPNITNLPLSMLSKQSGGSNPTIYVSSISGSDEDDGLTLQTPVKSLNYAVSKLPSSGGEIVVTETSEFRETINIPNSGHVSIKPLANASVHLFGSDILEITKVSGYENVYSAPCPSKPRGMGNGRGNPTIFEWGTPSKLIPDEERHFLQHGMAHRLPFTEMFEVDTSSLGTSPNKDEILQYLDSRLGEWYWEDGVIYLRSVEGGDASSNRYEHRVRTVLTHTSGTIELTRVNSWFSSNTGFQFSGLRTVRYGCKVFGSHADGFSDDANFTVSYKDEAAACGNDGFNGTLGISSAGEDFDYRLEAVYFDPYGHDNYDDGISFHYKGDATVYGGLFEYNKKADVVHVTGANCSCYDTEVRGSTSGFYTATSPTADNERVTGSLRCVNTVATGNSYSYHSAGGTTLTVVNGLAVNPKSFGYFANGGVLNTDRCNYIGEAEKMKSGAVNVLKSVPVT